MFPACTSRRPSARGPDEPGPNYICPRCIKHPLHLAVVRVALETSRRTRRFNLVLVSSPRPFPHIRIIWVGPEEAGDECDLPPGWVSIPS